MPPLPNILAGITFLAVIVSSVYLLSATYEKNVRETLERLDYEVYSVYQTVLPPPPFVEENYVCGGRYVVAETDRGTIYVRFVLEPEYRTAEGKLLLI